MKVYVLSIIYMLIFVCHISHLIANNSINVDESSLPNSSSRMFKWNFDDSLNDNLRLFSENDIISNQKQVNLKYIKDIYSDKQLSSQFDFSRVTDVEGIISTNSRGTLDYFNLSPLFHIGIALERSERSTDNISLQNEHKGSITANKNMILGKTTRANLSASYSYDQSNSCYSQPATVPTKAGAQDLTSKTFTMAASIDSNIEILKAKFTALAEKQYKKVRNGDDVEVYRLLSSIEKDITSFDARLKALAEITNTRGESGVSSQIREELISIEKLIKSLDAKIIIIAKQVVIGDSYGYISSSRSISTSLSLQEILKPISATLDVSYQTTVSKDNFKSSKSNSLSLRQSYDSLKLKIDISAIRTTYKYIHGHRSQSEELAAQIGTFGDVFFGGNASITYKRNNEANSQNVGFCYSRRDFETSLQYTEKGLSGNENREFMFEVSGSQNWDEDIRKALMRLFR